jgi:hypothetical protein
MLDCSKGSLPCFFIVMFFFGLFKAKEGEMATKNYRGELGQAFSDELR